jgi:beta-lactamase superfamily II metal-dependent hydrolase
MGFDIDMIAVSNGDAIVVRHDDPLTGAEWVGLVDGGQTDDDGEKVVQHVLAFTRSRKIDDLICTHPDSDHIGGLPRVVKRIPVGRAWIHDPGQHIDFDMLKRSLMSRTWLSPARKIYKSMTQCSDFLSLIDGYQIPRMEPFAGRQAGPFQFLGPTEWYYQELLRQFQDLDGVFIEEERSEVTKSDESYRETMDPDSVINEDNTTSAENNSSVISRIVLDGYAYLFTGDAGVPALERALAYGGAGNVRWLDVPHHGSKHNICSSLLDRLRPQVAYISAKGTRKHPSRAVINALKRRGCTCYGTFQTGTVSHGDSGLARPGWSLAVPL